MIPYTLVNNDLKFVVAPGFASGSGFYDLLMGAIELLRREGQQTPKMMSIGVHGRLSGHPARAASLARLLDQVTAMDDVWICRRADIARHWIATHPWRAA